MNAGQIVNIATNQSAASKNPAAVALGRLGGLKGGNARAAKLSPDKRKEIAQRAAKQRWANRDSKEIESMRAPAMETRTDDQNPKVGE